MKKTEKEFNFNKILEETRDGIQKNIVLSQGRLSMIEEIIQYLEVNNLKVVQTVKDDSTLDALDFEADNTK